MTARRRELTQPRMDHPRVKEQPGVLGAEPERFGDGGACLLGPTALQEGPRQHVPRVDIAPNLELLSGERHRFLRL